MSEKPENEAPSLGNPADYLVLVVDDDESLLDLMEHVIKKEGFKVELTTDGQEALEKSVDMRPDLIVLDFMLPGLSGIDIAKRLQSAPTAGIPILFMTGRRVDRKTIEAIRKEPNIKEYIEKPVRPVALAWTLHRILKTRPPDINRIVDRGPLSGGW